MLSIDAKSDAHGQFIRFEKYARVAAAIKPSSNSIYKIANEAMRVDGYCDHIRRPLEPAILFGVSPLEAVLIAEEWAAAQRVPYLHKPTKTMKSRLMRSDKSCAVVGVVSVPPQWNADARWFEFTDSTIAWLQSQYGSRLKSVIAHLDEHCLHLHFWLIPKHGETIGSVHAGEFAIETVGHRAPRIVRDTAYKQAMAALLDNFEVNVSRRFGLRRHTVNKKRLSRQEWLRQKELMRVRKLNTENISLEKILNGDIIATGLQSILNSGVGISSEYEKNDHVMIKSDRFSKLWSLDDTSVGKWLVAPLHEEDGRHSRGPAGG